MIHGVFMDTGHEIPTLNACQYPDFFYNLEKYLLTMLEQKGMLLSNELDICLLELEKYYDTVYKTQRQA